MHNKAIHKIIPVGSKSIEVYRTITCSFQPEPLLPLALIAMDLFCLKAFSCAWSLNWIKLALYDVCKPRTTHCNHSIKSLQMLFFFTKHSIQQGGFMEHDHLRRTTWYNMAIFVAWVKIRKDQKGSRNGASAKPNEANSSGLDLRP